MNKNKKIIFSIIIIIIVITLIIFLNKEKIFYNSNTYGNKVNTSNSTPEQGETSSYDPDKYYERMQDPDHWSEYSKKSNLAYALCKDKDTLPGNDYITKSDEVISSILPADKKGIYITYDARSYVKSIKYEVDDIFYIDDEGFLRYDKDNLDLSKKDFLDKFFISVIDKADKLYVVDISFGYVDEELETRKLAITFDGGVDYIRFNIDENTSLLMLNRYNYRFELLIEGIQKLTGVPL